MDAPVSKFYVKIRVGFCRTLESTFCKKFHFKSSRKCAKRMVKNMVQVIFKICFCVTIRENFECFQYFDFETDFLETKTFFKKLEYRFLVESTKIEKASFPYETAVSEAKVKTNRMVFTKWTYHKEQSFASNCFNFLKILFQLQPLLNS